MRNNNTRININGLAKFIEAELRMGNAPSGNVSCKSQVGAGNDPRVIRTYVVGPRESVDVAGYDKGEESQFFGSAVGYLAGLVGNSDCVSVTLNPRDDSSGTFSFTLKKPLPVPEYDPSVRPEGYFAGKTYAVGQRETS